MVFLLGVNLVFAGFVLTLNGLSYKIEVDSKTKGAANLLVGIVIAINAILQTVIANSYFEFGFAAAIWLFSLNYLMIAFHIFYQSENWQVFGIYSLFAAVFSIIFAINNLVYNGPWELVYMWIMWAILWGQSFVAITLKCHKADKLSGAVLVINGIMSTFIPGVLILLGIIL